MNVKFLVVSYDSNEQQTFWDYVIAADPDRAKAFIDRHRPYAIAVEAIRSEDLIGAAEAIQSADETTIVSGMRTVVADYTETFGRADVIAAELGLIHVKLRELGVTP